MLGTLVRARALCSTPGAQRATAITKILNDKLAATYVNVLDVSGGCGQMFQIEVASKKFEGKTLISQHRLVKELLHDHIAQMHGLTLKTFTPEQMLAKK